MPGFLKQSTAAQVRAIGPFVDDTDFKTPETGLTVANTDIKLVINGAASANKNSGGGTHRINGVYGLTFDATDTATVGEIQLSVVVAGALPVFDKFFVVEEAVYDALFAASAPGYLQPTTAGRTLDVTATGEAGIDWSNVGAPTTTLALTGTTIATTQKVDLETIKTQTVTCAGGVTVPAATLASTTNITAATGVDTTKWAGTTVSVPTVAGVPNVNVKTWNDLVTVALPLIPTTAGRTLDCSAGGEAGVDWANVGGKTTVNDLTATTIAVTQKVDVETIKTQAVTLAGGVTIPAATLASTANITAGTITTTTNVTNVSAGGITAASLAADTITAAKVASDVTDEIWAKACTEPTSVVAATPTAIAALSWMLTLSRNKITQTATAQIIKADDAATTIATSTVSDDGTTFTRGEFA